MIAVPGGCSQSPLGGLYNVKYFLIFIFPTWKDWLWQTVKFWLLVFLFMALSKMWTLLFLNNLVLVFSVHVNKVYTYFFPLFSFDLFVQPASGPNLLTENHFSTKYRVDRFPTQKSLHYGRWHCLASSLLQDRQRWPAQPELNISDGLEIID